MSGKGGALLRSLRRHDAGRRRSDDHRLKATRGKRRRIGGPDGRSSRKSRRRTDGDFSDAIVRADDDFLIGKRNVTVDVDSAAEEERTLRVTGLREENGRGRQGGRRWGARGERWRT